CEARAFVLLRLGLTRAVSAIGTPNPTTLIRLAAVARREADALLRAIHDGTLGIPWPPVHDEPGQDARASRAAINKMLRPDPGRARVLADIGMRRGTLRLADAWPELALIGCWLGGHAGRHAARLAADYGEAPVRDLGLVASEGRVTLPLTDGSAAGGPPPHPGIFQVLPPEA